MSHSIRDRISKRFQTRSLSSRYGDFSFDSSPRRRRRNGRHSSVCMSSAESTPLSGALASKEGQALVDAQSHPGLWRNAIDPLATASLMLATAELDRLSNRPGSDRSSEVFGSGWSSACGAPPNSPAMKSFASIRKPFPRMNTTSDFSEMSLIPRKPVPPGLAIRSSNSLTESTSYGSHRQRKTSSRFSEIHAPENILEASDEDAPPARFPSGVVSTCSDLMPERQISHSSLNSALEPIEPSCMRGTGSGPTADSSNQALVQAPSTQNAPSKNLWSLANSQHRRTSDGVNLDLPMNDSGGTKTQRGPAHALHTGELTPQNTRGLWCPSRGSHSSNNVGSGLPKW